MTYTTLFPQLGRNDVHTAGGKGANLGEMTKAGIPVPSGFVLTTEAYDAFVSENDLQQRIIDLASKVSADDPPSSEKASAAITRLFLAGEMPEAIQADLFAAYGDLTIEGEVPGCTDSQGPL